MHRLRPAAAALLLSVLLSSCLSHSRDLFRGPGHRKITGPAPPLKVATQDELNARITRIYDAIQSFQAVCSLTASKGSVYEGKITDYTAAPGTILFRKPDLIRIQANAPYVGTQVFDMVSDGSSFRLFLQEKNLFFVGSNSAPATSTVPLENLRPRAFLSSMLIHPADPATEVMMLKDDTDELDALYRLELNLRGPGGTLVPGREIWFDRDDLSIVRQKTYDEKGDTISDTLYSRWQTYNGVPFPSDIDINRRKDGYGVDITIEKLEMNKPIPDSKFVLPQPDASKLQVLQ